MAHFAFGDDADDDALFRAAVAGTRRLEDRDRTPGPVIVPRPRTRARQRPGFVLDRDGERVEGRAPGVSHEQLADLRAGKLRPEAMLDLHRMRAEEAIARLQRFVRVQAERGRRVLLVIHGRGLHSAAGPVLKDAVVRAMSTAPLAERIRAFCTATGRDGGPGATYVLVKRNR